MRHNTAHSIGYSGHDTIDFKKGSEEGEIDAIPKDKAEKIIEAINQGLQTVKTLQHGTTIVNQQLSVSDELTKIAKLKEQGIITDSEFQQMKQELIKKL